MSWHSDVYKPQTRGDIKNLRTSPLLEKRQSVLTAQAWQRNKPFSVVVEKIWGFKVCKSRNAFKPHYLICKTPNALDQITWPGISEVQPAHEHGQGETHVEGSWQSSSAATGKTCTEPVPKQNSQSLVSEVEWVGQKPKKPRKTKRKGNLEHQRVKLKFEAWH